MGVLWVVLKGNFGLGNVEISGYKVDREMKSILTTRFLGIIGGHLY